MLSTGVKYEPTNSVASGTDASDNQFTYYDETNKTWKRLATNESVTLKSSVYVYYPTTLTETSSDVNAKVGIASTSPEYKMLFTNSSTGADTANSGNTDNIYYWLGSPYVRPFTSFAYFGLLNVHQGFVTCNYSFASDGGTGTACYGVRPVVSLDSKVRLKDSGTNKDGCKLYNMTI